MLETERSAVHTVTGMVAPNWSKAKVTGTVALWHNLSAAVEISGVSVYRGKRHMFSKLRTCWGSLHLEVLLRIIGADYQNLPLLNPSQLSNG